MISGAEASPHLHTYFGPTAA
uniref:Uncharacterized protein n=1 Tax=Arundo donax TaxID=35708 RepID=A0A0A9C023_ARUDO